jgi:E3 ubiquitin-protein ligase TRIP12
MEFYALVSTELQRAELGLWNDGDSYKHQQVMADAVKSPAIPASDEQSQMIYIHQPSSASSVTNEDSSGNNNNNNSDNNVMNNNEINMLIEQSLDQQNEVVENQSNEGLVSTPRVTSALSTSANAQYVNAPCGLFPMSLSKTAKTSQLSRLRFKFKFLGKFMAKAVMDSRMVSSRDFASQRFSSFVSLLSSSWIFLSRYHSTVGF